MKKELIGIFIFMLLITTVLPVTGTIDTVSIEIQKEAQQIVVKKPNHTPTYSEQNHIELKDKFILFGEQLSNAETQEEKESILWEIALLYEKQETLPKGMTIDETYELLVSEYKKREKMESQYDEKPLYSMNKGFHRRYFVENGQVQMVDVPYREAIINDFHEDEIVEQPFNQMNIESNHPPIYIDGNDDFTSENGVTGGSGREGDPYIIENWVIVYDGVAENGIFVKNTDAYFIIRNCTVRSFTPEGYLGIRFNNVKNGRIKDTETFWNYAGIGIGDSEYITIFNCTSHNNNGWYARGIFCSDCSNITISSCEFYNNNGEAANGMELLRCSYCVIENTSSFNNDWHGLDIGHGHPPEDFQNLCKHNIIRDCKFYKNLLNGICFYSNRRLFFKYKGSSYNQIIRCEVYDNGHYPDDEANGFEGIRIDGYYNGVVIEDCDIHDNEYGITLSVSSYNIIRNCRIYNNIDETDYIGWGILVGGDFIGSITGEGEWAVNNEIVNCDIYNNEEGIWLCETFKSNVHKNNIYNNNFWGISVDNFDGISAAVHINYNNIYDNGFQTDYACGMMILERSICDARYNWWGADNGPKIFLYNYLHNRRFPIRPWGDGDRIFLEKAIVFLRPWVKKPIPDAG